MLKLSLRAMMEMDYLMKFGFDARWVCAAVAFFIGARRIMEPVDADVTTQVDGSTRRSVGLVDLDLG